jgi:hypothetical protein|nr:MAG TPA: C2HC5 zinc finger motif protein [Caudoviricetes sp.]
MCGDEKALARVVVKMLNTRRCDWPWPERIVTGEDVRGILRRLAVDEDEVTEWIEDRRQWVSIMDALIDNGYVYLDSRSAQQPYGPLCRSCEREVCPAELGWADTAGESDCARCANPIPGSGRGVSIYVW